MAVNTVRIEVFVQVIRELVGQLFDSAHYHCFECLVVPLKVALPFLGVRMHNLDPGEG